MAVPGNLGSVRRDPRIRLTGRPCAICRENAPIGLMINLRGYVMGCAVICKGCWVRIGNVIAYGNDAELNIDVPPGGGKVIHLG